MVLPSRTEKHRQKNARLRGHFLCFGVADGVRLTEPQPQYPCGFPEVYTRLCVITSVQGWRRFASLKTPKMSLVDAQTF
jgi:hypothetical protein